MKQEIKVGIVVPCYNEEEIIEVNVIELLNLLDRLLKDKLIASDSFIALVDDRSKDNTWEIIKSLKTRDKRVKAIRLASNRGHQYALFAGLMEFKDSAECLVSIDADLQDDLNIIEEMLIKFKQGNQIVFGVRKNRKSDKLFKRLSARLFYRIMKIFKTEGIFNHADFRLTSKKVLDELKNYKEINLYLRGLFPVMGFDTAIVYYDRKKRTAGISKYPVGKMISLALDGITSFSVVPLRMITFIGFIVFFICVCLMGYALLAFVQHKTIPGWFSTVLPFYFLGGIQILCIGIIGEYLGKIYKEVKGRPRYIVDERL